MRKQVLSIAAVCALSASAAQPNDTVNASLYRLFTPLTFYHNVSAGMLSIDCQNNDVEDAVDQALMNVYLNRPDLVEATETQLEQTGSLREDIDEPIAQTVALVEHVAPMPEEPEVLPAAEVVVTKPKFWTRKGDGFLQFMQNYISDNWYKGGESTYSLLGSLTLEANYDNKGKWKWDNKLEAKLGFLTAKSDSLHKWKSNEDLLRLTSKVGLQASKRWYYTLQLLAWTQFARGLKSNDHRVYSDFFSPFNLNVGLGMDYKVEAFDKKLTGTVNLSPIAVNYRYVDRTAFPKQNSATPTDYSWFPSRHGIDDGKRSLVDPGSQLTADLTWKLSETVQWKSRFWAFTSYKRAEIEWENTFQLKVSKYITANIFLYPRFDDGNAPDDDLGYWQFKEYTSIGLSYSF
ncbi:MAG: DUF3078 domain-containing protein [Prevotella sp.]|nr:DUF3078 domain-containing protein [Prevotella sp.]